MFDRVLVANRGEISVRVTRTLHRLGIESVAVHSEVDATDLHVRVADHAVLLGPAPLAQSYLSVERIIDAALTSGSQAVHPGYGLLSESDVLADACREAGLVFIGPTAESIRLMGSKVNARRLMAAAGVPVVPGSPGPVVGLDQATAEAEAIGYPVAVKASGAGGGRGFRVARGPVELAGALQGASDEGLRFFGDGTVYLERYLDDPRHVEVQILADAEGHTVHLFERDCSVQRRHQKLVEESPAPHLSADQRQRMFDIAVKAAEAVGYRSAGTVEGLVADGQFYFLEMNTRIQVEHPVTEMVTGIDVVEEQIRVAAGLPLSVTQADVRCSGHAIECRINVEDAARGFLPRPGTVTAYGEPSGDGVRVDAALDSPTTILPYYDSLLAKVIVWAEDREQATARMLDALAGFTIAGVSTLVPFHSRLLASPQWRAGETCRDLIEDRAWLAETSADTVGTPSR
jgi:acetyl-CoA carboxylase biotin carboxylase subunit